MASNAQSPHEEARGRGLFDVLIAGTVEVGGEIAARRGVARPEVVQQEQVGRPGAEGGEAAQAVAWLGMAIGSEQLCADRADVGLQPCRQHPIDRRTRKDDIGVEHQHPRRRRLAHAGVDAAGEPEIAVGGHQLGLGHPHADVLAGAVGRGVVDHDDRPTGGHGSVERTGEVAAGVPGDEDERDGGGWVHDRAASVPRCGHRWASHAARRPPWPSWSRCCGMHRRWRRCWKAARRSEQWIVINGDAGTAARRLVRHIPTCAGWTVQPAGGSNWRQD